MPRRTTIIAATSILAALAVGTGVAASNAADDDRETETPITGDALVQASDAALAHTGGGRVTGTEVGDEESYYEVEVTLDDGTEVDVQLDADFRVVSSEAEGADDERTDEDGE